MAVFIFRCRDCQHEAPPAGSKGQDNVDRPGRCERCGGPLEIGRQSSPDPVAESARRGVVERLQLRDVWSSIAETWYAWHVSRRMLKLYQQVRSECDLTGKSLYEQVIMRWSRADSRSTAAILRHAEESFCTWPASHDLRFRNVVHYVVVCEYLQARKGNLGTQTRMGTTVARVVPNDL